MRWDKGNTSNNLVKGDMRLEHELLLCCSRTSIDADRAEHIRALLQQDVEWAYLLNSARRHGVVPLTYRALRTVGPDLIPDSFVDQLQGDFHTWGMATHMRMKELGELIGLFDAHDVPVISFKGPALGAYAYGNPTHRKPSGDLDILVRREDFSAAREIVIDFGFIPRVQPDEEPGYRKRRGSLPFDGSRGSIDVHWTLKQQSFDSFPYSWTYNTRRIWERSTTISLANTTIQTLATEDVLPYLCVHGVKHSWCQLYLICDIAELLHRHRDVNWQPILEQASRMDSERILYLGLLLANRLLGADLPEIVRVRIQNDPQVAALAVHVCDQLFDPSHEVDALKHHLFRVRMLKRWHEKAFYLLYRGMRKLSKVEMIKRTKMRASSIANASIRLFC